MPLTEAERSEVRAILSEHIHSDSGDRAISRALEKIGFSLSRTIPVALALVSLCSGIIAA